ncbi:MAG: hypothetical protein ACE5IR_25360 [bacterium]
MKILMSLILSLSMALPVWAGSFTVTSTAEQDVVLNKMLVELNTKRAAENPPKPALTLDQMVKGIMTNAFKSYVRSDRAKSHQSLRKAWKGATQADRDQIKTILGVP